MNKSPSRKRSASPETDVQRTAELPHSGTSELVALQLLNRASTRLWQTRNLDEGLHAMLEVTVELLGADFGNIQLYDPKDRVLRIAAHRGFKRRFLNHFREVTTKDNEASGRALRSGRRIIIEDVKKDSAYAPHRAIARSAGYRALQSTPLVAHDGRRLGMISTHWRRPHRPGALDLRSLDLYARQAADFIERCTAEQKLRESEGWFRQMAENVKEVFWLTDMKLTTMLYVSPAFEEIWGTSCAELYKNPRRWLESVHRDDRERVKEAFRIGRVQEFQVDVEYRIVRPDGTIRWISDHGAVIKDGNGKWYRRAGVAKDITAHRLAEDALRASEAKFRRLHESLHDAFVSVEMKGRIQEFNSAYAEMLGYTPEELHRLTYVDLTPKRWHRIEARIVREEILPRGYSGVYEKEYRRKDGTIFPVELRTFLIRDEKGKPQSMWAIVRDITERKKAEEELRNLNTTLEQRVARRTHELHQREERLRAILNTVVDAIITIDRRGIITSVNPATMRLFGYSEEEMTGKNVKLLMPAPYHDEHDGYIANYHRTGEAKIIGIGREVQARHKDGTVFPIELAVSEVKELGIYTGVIRDITERRKMEKEILEISEQERRAIGQDLHDDLGQRIAGAALTSTALLRELRTAGSTHAGLADMLRETLAEALELTRSLARGLHPMAAVSGGLHAALDELARRAESMFGISCRFTADAYATVSDDAAANHLYRIAQESVTNAVKHGRAQDIQIALRVTPNGLTLAISDDGPGIAESSRGREGIGLRIMRYRADLMGGRLDISSGRKGGTVVRCTIQMPVTDNGKEETR